MARFSNQIDFAGPDFQTKLILRGPIFKPKFILRGPIFKPNLFCFCLIEIDNDFFLGMRPFEFQIKLKPWYIIMWELPYSYLPNSIERSDLMCQNPTKHGVSEGDSRFE